MRWGNLLHSVLLFKDYNLSIEEPLSELLRERRAVRKIEPKSAE